mgnify:CR=1 FL=1
MGVNRMPDVSERVSRQAYWLAQRFATSVINQYARSNDKDFHLVSDEPGRYRYYPLSTEADERELASLEGMLRLGVPWLWLAPAWWGTAFYFNRSVGSLQFFGGSILFFTGVFGWYFASQFTSNTSVEYGIAAPGASGEQLGRTGVYDVGEAIRRIEEVEDELCRVDDVEDIRERLTEARADLVDALLEREVKR